MDERIFQDIQHLKSWLRFEMEKFGATSMDLSFTFKDEPLRLTISMCFFSTAPTLKRIKKTRKHEKNTGLYDGPCGLAEDAAGEVEEDRTGIDASAVEPLS